jgi:phenylacetate-CoA ligase
MRHNKWAGWDIGEKTALMWGLDNNGNENLKSKIKNYYISKKLWLNAFDLSEKNILTFANQLKKYKPSIIIGYSNALFTFFKVLKEKHISIPSPKGIISSAEVLYPWQRELIEHVSGTQVFNRYGSREIGLICSECNNQSGMHINAESIYLECIKDNKSVAIGEVGNVVATDLLNYGMPLIRYNTEDNATFSDKMCDCGRGLPLVQTIHGRSSDMIKAEDGRLIHGEYFTHLFYGINGINKFQLIQKKDGSIELMIDVKPNFNRNIIENLKFKIIKAIKSKNVNVNIVDKIPLLKSGKHRFTISEI